MRTFFLLIEGTYAAEVCIIISEKNRPSCFVFWEEKCVERFKNIRVFEDGLKKLKYDLILQQCQMCDDNVESFSRFNKCKCCDTFGCFDCIPEKRRLCIVCRHSTLVKSLSSPSLP